MNRIVQNPSRVVYTALIGNYDQLSPICFDTTIKFVLFTDVAGLSVKGWETRNIFDYSDLCTEAPGWMVNRQLKMQPHIFLPEFLETLYIDSNIRVLKDPEYLFAKYLSRSDIAIPLHPERQDISEELRECLRTGKLVIEEATAIEERIRHYKAIHHDLTPMTENNVILRRSTPAVIKAMDTWWAETISGVKRDQISLAYALCSAGVAASHLLEGPRYTGQYMTIRAHWPNGQMRNVRYFVRTLSALRHRSKLNLIIARLIDLLVYVFSTVGRKRS